MEETHKQTHHEGAARASHGVLRGVEERPHPLGPATGWEKAGMEFSEDVSLGLKFQRRTGVGQDEEGEGMTKQVWGPVGCGHAPVGMPARRRQCTKTTSP